MESLIYLMNKLQDVFQLVGNEISFTLPRIAVVGGQSAGKSTLLENVVGKTFLPSGSGIVTRRPLVLQLINHNGGEYGEFSHKPGVRFDNLVGINEEIRKETDRICKPSQVSPEPINLRVYSPHVTDLTLVDLPGLTRVATMGQDASIVGVIRNMVSDYIKDENCLILAVTPATQDSATSDAIELAKLIDPDGDRTIGVVTKLDSTLQSYTQVIETIQNRIVPLKRGYIGVINRNPNELKQPLDREGRKEFEKRKLDLIPAYKPVANRCGIVLLQDFLQKQLMEHISRSLPALKSTIDDQLRSIESELENTDMLSDDVQSQITVLTKVIKQFIDCLEADLGFQKEIVKDFKDITYGSRVREAIFVQYPKKLAQNLRNYRSKLTQIAININSTSGIFSENSFSTPAFHKSVRDFLKSNRPIVMDVLLQVKGMLLDLVKKEATEMIKYDNLKTETINVCNSFIQELYKLVQEHLNFMLDSQEAYIDAGNPDYVRLTRNEISTPIQTLKKSDEDEIIEASDLKYMKRGGMLSSKKDGYGEIFRDKLVLYGNSKKTDFKMSFILASAFYKLLPSDRCGLILTIPSGGSVELTFANEDLLHKWCVALHSVDVIQADVVKPSDKSRGDKTSDAGDEEDPEVEEEIRPSNITHHTWNAAKQISYSVGSYVSVTNRTLHDVSSKVVCNGLVVKFREKICTILVANLINLLIEKDLMKQSDLDMDRIKKLRQTREALRTALEVINDPSAVAAQSSAAKRFSQISSQSSNSIRNNQLTNGPKQTSSFRPQSSDDDSFSFMAPPGQNYARSSSQLDMFSNSPANEIGSMPAIDMFSNPAASVGGQQQMVNIRASPARPNNFSSRPSPITSSRPTMVPSNGNRIPFARMKPPQSSKPRETQSDQN